MPQLPIISGGETIKILTKQFGYEVARMRGSHVTLVKHGNPLIITVPLHDELDRGTLRAILRKAGIEVDDFVKCL